MFAFKQFIIDDGSCAMKVGTDSVLLGAWVDTAHCSRVVDIGAGSGILSLMVAQRCADAMIAAIEIDTYATAAARHNFAASKWADRLTAINADALTFMPDSAPDLLICNPPYFADSLKSPDSQRTQARHTGTGSFGPLSCISLAKRWLSDSGSLAMVTPADIEDAITYEAELAHLNIWRKCLVSTIEGKSPTRILWQISKDRRLKYQPSSMAVRCLGNKEYTTEYINLTKDFYLHL